MDRIREAVPTDLPAVARIWHDGWRDGHLGHVPETLLQHRTYDTFEARAAARLGRTWVAEVDGSAVGFVVVVDDEIEQVYVSGEARGTGVAGELLDRAESEIRANGHLTAWLAVVAGNARARAFYERSGWRDVGDLIYHAETATGTVSVPCRRYEKRLG